MNLEQLTRAVVSNFRKMQEPEIIARIMLITGYGFKRACRGYQYMAEKKVFPEGFICEKTAGKFFHMIERNPMIAEMFETLDCLPGNFDLSKSPLTITFVPPPELKPEQIRARLNYMNFAELDF